MWYGDPTRPSESKNMPLLAKHLFPKKALLQKREKLDIWKLLPNELYKAYLEPSIGKDKMRFYWNPKMNPLNPPKTQREFARLMNEDNGGEVFYLKNGANVIFINYWKTFSVFYSLDKQKLLFRQHMKSIYFNKL